MFVGNTVAYRRGASAMLLFAAVAADFAHAQRETILMNGVWQIANRVSAEEIPVTSTHTGPVPAPAHSAKPPFPDVDRYDSGPLLHNLVDQDMAPKSILAELGDKKGISRQQRNYLWYSRTFAAPAKRSVAFSQEPGKYTLKAMATESRDSTDPAISRRRVTLKEAPAVGPKP